MLYPEPITKDEETQITARDTISDLENVECGEEAKYSDVHDPRYLQPMQGNRNSSKRDRLSMEDLDKILEVEKRTGIYPASWYVKKVWEYIKANYKAHPEKIETIYRDSMKQNMTNFMHLLYAIISISN